MEATDTVNLPDFAVAGFIVQSHFLRNLYNMGENALSGHPKQVASQELPNFRFWYNFIFCTS